MTLFWNVLYDIMLEYIVWHYFGMYCITLFWNVLYDIILECIV